MRLITDKPEDPVATIVSVFNNEKTKQTESVDPPPADVASDAKDYLQKHKIAFLVEDWLRALLEAKPEFPLDFSCDYFSKMAGNKQQPATSGEEQQENKPASNDNAASA